MSVLVDTSVWIDFFHGTQTAKVALLESLITRREDICCCGFVLTEVLQGIRNNREYLATKQILDGLIYLDCGRSTFELSATIYRELRKNGATIRNSVDCLIAATVIQHGVHLLEKDRDFEHIDLYYPLNRI